MSANSNILAADAIVTLGAHQFKIIKKAGKSSKGKAVWEAHLIRKEVADPEYAFVIKYDELYNPIFPSKADFSRCERETEKQSKLFESMVYWLGNNIVMLMPKLPGEPILNIYGQPTHPCLVELSLSERLELAALVSKTYLEFHAKGLIHIDLNPNNVLIVIKRINGKVYFQINILDFTDTVSSPIFTAPENRFSSLVYQNVKSDIYLQTPIIATILGENNVFKHKWARMNSSSLELELGVEQAPFCLTGMQSYLIEELFKLQNTQFSVEEIAQFIQIGMKAYLMQELFEWQRMNLSKKRLFEIVTNARNLYLTHKINGMINETNDTMKSYLIKALFETPGNTLSQDDITHFINNSPMAGFLEDELFIWVDVVASFTNRMGSDNPKDRPEETIICKVFNKAALVCREREIALRKKEGNFITETLEQNDASELVIPVKNHLLIECGIFVRVHQKIIQKAKQINSDTSNIILFHAERITKEDTSVDIIKNEAQKAIGRANERGQSFFGFLYGDNSKLYQDIIDIIVEFEQQRKIGIAILEKMNNRDSDIDVQMHKLAQELIAGNGNEETLQKIRSMAQAVIESAEEPGEEHIPILDYVEVYKNILTIIDSSNAQSSEDASAMSTQPSHYYLPTANGDTAHFRIGQK